MATQGLVGERALHHRLTVVERAVDGKGDHAGTGPGDLGFLHAADADAGIEDHGADAGDAGAGFGHGGAGVAGGRGEHGQLREFVAEDARGDAHERADGEVLEGRGRALEEFEDGDALGRGALELLRPHEGDREIEGFLTELTQHRRAEHFTEIRGHDGLGEVGVGGGAVTLHEVGRDLRDMRRHPEPSLGGHGRQEHVAERAAARGVGGGDEFELTIRRGHGHPWD